MKQLIFKRIDTKNNEEARSFDMLMRKYMKEIDENENNVTVACNAKCKNLTRKIQNS